MGGDAHKSSDLLVAVLMKWKIRSANSVVNDFFGDFDTTISHFASNKPEPWLNNLFASAFQDLPEAIASHPVLWLG